MKMLNSSLGNAPMTERAAYRMSLRATRSMYTVFTINESTLKTAISRLNNNRPTMLNIVFGIDAINVVGSDLLFAIRLLFEILDTWSFAVKDTPWFGLGRLIMSSSLLVEVSSTSPVVVPEIIHIIAFLFSAEDRS